MQVVIHNCTEVPTLIPNTKYNSQAKVLRWAHCKLKPQCFYSDSRICSADYSWYFTSINLSFLYEKYYLSPLQSALRSDGEFYGLEAKFIIDGAWDGISERLLWQSCRQRICVDGFFLFDFCVLSLWGALKSPFQPLSHRYEDWKHKLKRVFYIMMWLPAGFLFEAACSPRFTMKVQDVAVPLMLRIFLLHLLCILHQFVLKLVSQLSRLRPSAVCIWRSSRPGAEWDWNWERIPKSSAFWWGCSCTPAVSSRWELLCPAHVACHLVGEQSCSNRGRFMSMAQGGRKAQKYFLIE